MSNTKNGEESLRVAIWNANGLANKRNSLELFAEDQRVDVILVCETRMGPAQNPRLRNFDMFRWDRQNHLGGGVAVYVKRSIQKQQIAQPELTNLEVCGVGIQTGHAGLIKFYAAYNPPNRQLMDSDLLELLDDDSPVIVAGDLNAKHASWNSRVTNGRGNTLFRFAAERNIQVIGPTEPTHYGVHGRPDVLDIAILNNIPYRAEIETVHDLDSDHNPVLLHLEVEDLDFAPSTIDLVDYEFFKETLQSTVGPVPSIHSVEEIDIAVEHLEQKMLEAKSTATRSESLRKRRDVLPQDIRDLIRERNRARKRYHRTLAPEDRTEKNRLIAEVRRQLAEYREETWNNRLESLATEDKSLWRMTKILRHKRTTMPPIHGTTGVVFTEKQKAEAFADNLETQCSPNYTHADLDHIEQINRGVRKALRDTEDSEIIRPTSPSEVRTIIKQLKIKKAPGKDGITNKMIRHAPPKAVMHIVAIINAILRLRYFPDKWKVADVIVIPKPGGQLQFPQNYRPISLLPCLGKVAEKAILWRLKEYESQLHVIPDEQFGFRESHSTTDQVLRVVENIATGFEWNRYTGTVFLDVSKAFDKTWHNGLLHKFIQAGFPIGIIKLMKSYLTNRFFTVKIGSTRSSRRRITAGVPQGALLSPFLYSIYTSDMPRMKEDAATTVALYADDTAVMVRHKSAEHATTRLQDAVERLEQWFRDWRIEVNAAKSVAVMFSKRRSHHPAGEVSMFGTPIPWADQAKYLGVILDKKLTFRPHLTCARQKAIGVMKQLYPMIHRRSRLSMGNKLLMYKMIVRPTMLYASPVWGHAARSHIESLQRVQNNYLRLALNAPWYVRNSQLHREADMPALKTVITDSARRAFHRAENHPNHLVQSAVDYDENICRHKRPRLALNSE